MDKKEGNKGRRPHGRKGDPKKRDTAPVTLDSEARLQNEAPQPKPRGGRCGADRRRRNWQKLSICTYNTRTMSHQDDLDRLLDQLNDIDWNVVGLCETKKRGEGLTELPCGTWMFDVGKTEDRPHAKGLAFLVNKSFKDFIVSFHAHSDRIISCILNLKNETLQIVQVYAPTTDYDDETIEKFYDDLEEAIDRKNNTHVIVMGDFNAKIGKKGKDENNNWIGNHGIGVRNERGERLLDFAAENRLFITNTLFEKQTSRYWTWESPGGIYKNQIDFILTTDKTIFQNTEILTQVDIGSDHRLLRGKIKMNKKLTRL